MRARRGTARRENHASATIASTTPLLISSSRPNSVAGSAPSSPAWRHARYTPVTPRTAKQPSASRENRGSASRAGGTAISAASPPNQSAIASRCTVAAGTPSHACTPVREWSVSVHVSARATAHTPSATRLTWGRATSHVNAKVSRIRASSASPKSVDSENSAATA